MKKIAFLSSLVLLLGLAMGCSSGSDWVDPNAPEPLVKEWDFTDEIKLPKNTWWKNGVHTDIFSNWQTDPLLPYLKDAKVKKGDIIKVEITATPNRDIKNSIGIDIIDNNAAVNYWLKLTEEPDPNAEETYEIPKDPPKFLLFDGATKGVPVTGSVEIPIVVNATGKGDAKIQLYEANDKAGLNEGDGEIVFSDVTMKVTLTSKASVEYPIVLWEGEVVLGNWKNNVQIPAEKFKDCEAEDGYIGLFTLELALDDDGPEWHQVKITANDSAKTVLPDLAKEKKANADKCITVSDNLEFTLSEDELALVQKDGMFINGCSAKLKKLTYDVARVVVQKPAAGATSEKVKDGFEYTKAFQIPMNKTYNKETECKNFQINLECFGDYQFVEDDEIKITLTATSDVDLTKLQASIVDTSPAASYWTVISNSDVVLFESDTKTKTITGKEATFTIHTDATAKGAAKLVIYTTDNIPASELTAEVKESDQPTLDPVSIKVSINGGEIKAKPKKDKIEIVDQEVTLKFNKWGDEANEKNHAGAVKGTDFSDFAKGDNVLVYIELKSDIDASGVQIVIKSGNDSATRDESYNDYGLYIGDVVADTSIAKGIMLPLRKAPDAIDIQADTGCEESDSVPKITIKKLTVLTMGQ